MRSRCNEIGSNHIDTSQTNSDNIENINKCSINIDIERARNEAIESLKDCDSEYLGPICVEDHKNKVIIVTFDEDNILVSIYNRPLAKESLHSITVYPSLRFRHIHLINLDKCSVLINAKILRLYICNVKHSSIKSDHFIIGPTEIFKSSNVDLDMNCSEKEMGPLTSLEQSKRIKIIQRCDIAEYISRLSTDITFEIMTPSHYGVLSFQRKLFDHSSILSVSKTCIKQYSLSPACLNSLDHHFIH